MGDSQERRKQKFSIGAIGAAAPRGFRSHGGPAEAFSKFLSASRLFDRPVPSVGMAPDHRDHLSRASIIPVIETEEICRAYGSPRQVWRKRD